ncbi:RNA polymerase sigma factor RpoE [Phycisphaerae bacterium RAS1]|nr:RNA polymerase sigma factor RpoE [Phycisphaerae bacterium RAS1]
MSATDRSLIQDCLRGDAAAWDRFVARYSRLVYSIPRKLGLTEADCDDVFQTVFGVVVRRLESLRDESRTAAWLVRTTYRESWRVAKRRRGGPAELPGEYADPQEPNEEEVLRLERQHLIRAGLAELEPRCRELLELLFFEAETPDYAEISRRTGIAVGGIGPTRARCFKKLETILGRHGFR